MASLAITQNTLRVSLVSRQLEIERRDEETSARIVERVPLYDIDRVVVSGRPNITMPTMISFMEEGIPVFFISSRGKWRGCLESNNNLNANRRIAQYEKSSDINFSLMVARRLIAMKIKNSRRVLQRLAANREATCELEYKIACRALNRIGKRIKRGGITLEELRGYEGIGAAIYFKELDRYFSGELRLGVRSRRPPLNPVNAMLSWGYTIIMGEMESILRQHGLDVGIGNLHRDRQNTPSLALDLIEPLRSAIVDLLVLNIVNHGMVKAEEHFERRDDGGIYLNAEGRKIFFQVYEQAMTRKFTLEKGGQKIDFRQVMHEQVYQYIRVLEGGESPCFFQLP